jgi:hypothetical protein
MPRDVWTPPLVLLVSVAQSCVRHHSQYHHRHTHVQVCHVALFEIVAPASVAGFVVVGVLLFASPSGFVAPSCIIEQASLLPPVLFGLALWHARGTRTAATCVV